jgi:YhcH/YjgK/YiaL family protein
LNGTEIEINGRALFLRPGEYKTRLPEEGRFEAHKVYADLQYVISGAEIMQFAPLDALTPATEYDPKGDISFFTAERDITDIVVRAGEFVVYFPGEAHRPMCQRGLGPEAVKKLVFKIRIQ